MVAEMKAFDGLVGRPDTAEEWISEFEDVTVETSKKWTKTKRLKNRTEYLRTVGQVQNV